MEFIFSFICFLALGIYSLYNGSPLYLGMMFILLSLLPLKFAFEYYKNKER